MDWFIELVSPGNTSLAATILLYAFVISAGVYLGKIKIFGVSLGVTFVLFVGILMGHFGYAVDAGTLHFVREFGLILFIFSIGLQVGPGFFSSFKKGGMMLNGLAVLVVLLNVAIVLAIFYIDGNTSIVSLVGVMSGAVTNTPGLGAAQQALLQVAPDSYSATDISGGDTIVPEWEFLQFPDNIMPKVLSQVDVDKFFMPFDIGNDYQLEVLRHIPDGKKVVLGVADAHSPFTESATDILDTVAKASKYVSPERLSVSPKTGFKLTSYASRGLTYECQWQKLAQLREVLGI